MMDTFELNTPLLKLGLTNAPGGVWTIGNAVEGVQILGGIGSGKTSGSGRALAHGYLKAGFGGLVLTVKPTEKEDWIGYCKAAGREKDLIVLEPGGLHNFNFLAYESSKAGSASAITENLVQVLKTVIHASEGKQKTAGDDGFWEAALDTLLTNTIDLCQLAYGYVSVEHLFKIVQTLPKLSDKTRSRESPPTAFERAREKLGKRIEPQMIVWEATLSKDEIDLYQDLAFMREAAAEAIPDLRITTYIDQFFYETLGSLHEKTRSIIDFSFSSFIYRLLREPFYSLFCRNESTVTPEDSFQGKIILVNLPVKLYHKVGRDCQIMFKYIWQRAMERRDVRANGRPVFLWADEAQHFLHEHDAEFQATARSSRVATVYLTQNLPNYYAAMGGAMSEYRVQSFLGTLATKIFHANADIETNRYASALVGEHKVSETSKNVSFQGTFGASKTTSEGWEPAMRPEAFVQLKTGGHANSGLITALVHRQGSPIEDGKNHVIQTFKQDQTP